MTAVTVYVTNYCPYCTAAKQFLDRLGVAYSTIDVTGDHEKRDWLVKTSGQRTVPQIFVGKTSVGGFTDMKAMDARGDFKPLLELNGVSWAAKG